MPPRSDHHDATSSGVLQQQAVQDFESRRKLLNGDSSSSVTATNKAPPPRKAAPLATASKLRSRKVATNSSTKGKTTTAAAATEDATTTTPATDSSMALLNSNSGMYGSMLGGMGMMGGMYGSPYGMMGGMYGSPYGGGPLTSLNQFLFGVQTAIFSLGQAVQVIGMNTHALHQLVESASTMVDHAISTFHEMRAIEAADIEHETEEQQKRRRRIKALRYALVVAATYAAYRLVRSLLQRSRRKPRPLLMTGGDPTQQHQYHLNSNDYGGGSYYPHQQRSYPSPYYSPYGNGYGSSMAGFGGGPGGFH